MTIENLKNRKKSKNLFSYLCIHSVWDESGIHWDLPAKGTNKATCYRSWLNVHALESFHMKLLSKQINDDDINKGKPLFIHAWFLICEYYTIYLNVKTGRKIVTNLTRHQKSPPLNTHLLAMVNQALSPHALVCLSTCESAERKLIHRE